MANARRVIIIGGGIAGLASAVFAIRKGWQPVLLEASPQCGGRARSLSATAEERPLDNGQHVLSASYRETLSLLKTLGSSDSIRTQPRLTVNYRWGASRRFRLAAWPLPSPLHTLLPLILQTPVPIRELLMAAKQVMPALRSANSRLDKMTAAEWLGHSPFLHKLLWEPITLATLNTSYNHASARLLKVVLQQAFLQSSNASGLALIEKPLSQVFSAPAENYICEHGGEIHTASRIKKFVCEGNRIKAAITASGKSFEGEAIISALPPHALERIQFGEISANKLFALISDFQYSPIITIYLRSKRRLPVQTPLAIIDSPLQWIFELEDTRGYLYSLVISAALQWVDWPTSKLEKMAFTELETILGANELENSGIGGVRVIKERRATIWQDPASLRLRPASKTHLPNFFLVGDWIDTGLPATIESAVLSARNAVNLL